MFKFYPTLMESILEFTLVADEVVQAATNDQEILSQIPTSTFIDEIDNIDIADGFRLKR